MSSEQQVSLADVPALLEGHHHEVQDEVSKKDIIHVFAITGAPVFGTPERSGTFISSGASWDSSGSATLSVRIPIIGTFQIASVNGNLQHSVSVTFSIPSILSGSARFYLVNNKWLCVDLSATVFEKKGSITISLIPIP
ncbi:hypothetical protein BJV74DRAFT_799326 [Russula compacta]|nr:hypothetical protein BJV74DRAFT_799326 [Russula compacta]